LSVATMADDAAALLQALDIRERAFLEALYLCW
jgi:hypothetical protein